MNEEEPVNPPIEAEVPKRVGIIYKPVPVEVSPLKLAEGDSDREKNNASYISAEGKSKG